MSEPNITEIGKEFYHIKSPEDDLHRNIYVKRFIGEDGSRVNMVFDPGTKLDTFMLTAALKKLIGGANNVNLIFLSHQDPDVASNTHVILANAPRAIIVTSIDTFRLVRMYGIPERNFFLVEHAKSEILQIQKTKHKVQFVPAYFCHFKGAMMFYDFESKVLFTGDFLGGVNTRKGEGIYANEESFGGISLFHQIYMPAKQAIQDTVERISMLNPDPEVIAPQHGDVITGNNIPEFLARISKLDVGLNIIKKAEPQKDLVMLALNSFLDTLHEKEPDIHAKFTEEMKATGGFTTIFMIANDTITELKTSPEDALTYLWNIIEKVSPSETLTDVRTELAETLDNFGIALPPGIFETAERASDLGIVEADSNPFGL